MPSLARCCRWNIFGRCQKLHTTIVVQLAIRPLLLIPRRVCVCARIINQPPVGVGVFDLQAGPFSPSFSLWCMLYASVYSSRFVSLASE
eukprot:scaffold68436_cov18-Prasinocladus_malaysianus.AAC.2